MEQKRNGVASERLAATTAADGEMFYQFFLLCNNVLDAICIRYDTRYSYIQTMGREKSAMKSK